MPASPSFIRTASLLALVATGSAIAVEPVGTPRPEPKLNTPAGVYRLCRLPMKDGALLIGLRDRKAVVACLRTTAGQCLELDPASVTFDDRALKGTFPGVSVNRKVLKVVVDATVEGGKLVGATPGEIRTAGDMDTENALAAGPGWPFWYGPNGDFSGQDAGRPVVTNFAEARLVWVSEARLRHANTGQPTGYGGFSSPVVGDGKVFLNQYRACGPTASLNLTDAPKETISGNDYVPIEADDEVWCFDAASGRTLWSVSFPNASVNQPQKDKHVLWNQSGCYHDGVVYMFGFTYRIYALDARTGRVLWQGDLGKAHEQCEKDKAGMVAGKSLRNLFGRGGSNSFLAIADGVLFANNMVGGVNACDPKTGRLVWTATGAFPHRWVCQNKEYILVLNGGLECLDPKTGKAVWKDGGVGGGSPNALLVSGDYLLAQVGDRKGGYTTQYWKLSPTGATRIGDDKQYTGFGGYLAGGHKGKFMVRWEYQDGKNCNDNKIQSPWTLTDGATGKALAVAPLGNGGGWNTWSFFLEGQPLVCLDGGHGSLNPLLLGLDLGTIASWSTPATGGYDIALTHPYVDGRWFIRANNRIYCFDLRRPK